MKILGKAGAGNQAVVIEVLCDAVVLRPLIFQLVVKSRKRRVIVEKRIQHRGVDTDARGNSCRKDDEVFNPSFFVHRAARLSSSLKV